MKHTPTLPWKEHGLKLGGILDSSGNTIATAISLNNEREAEEIAKFIIHAVNSHDELLEAAKGVFNTSGYVPHGYCSCALCSLRKAIKKAEAK